MVRVPLAGPAGSQPRLPHPQRQRQVRHPPHSNHGQIARIHNPHVNDGSLLRANRSMSCYVMCHLTFKAIIEGLPLEEKMRRLGFRFFLISPCIAHLYVIGWSCLPVSRWMSRWSSRGKRVLTRQSWTRSSRPCVASRNPAPTMKRKWRWRRWEMPRGTSLGQVRTSFRGRGGWWAVSIRSQEAMAVHRLSLLLAAICH